MEAHPARTLGWNTRKLERVRCSSLVDWPVYPRLGRIMQGSRACAQFGPTQRCRDKSKRQGLDAGRTVRQAPDKIAVARGHMPCRSGRYGLAAAARAQRRRLPASGTVRVSGRALTLTSAERRRVDRVRRA